MEHNDLKISSKHRRVTGKKIGRIIGTTLIGILIAALFALVFGMLVKILWNWLMPAIFGIGKISYWQAFGILILVKFLFGNFGSHHEHHSHDRFHQKIDARYHHFTGNDEDSGEGTERSSPKWKYYEKFWRDEGKSAFESYIQRLESEKNKKN